MGRPTTTVRTVSTAVGIVYAVVLYVCGVHLQDGARKALAYLPTLVTLVLAAWDVWLWRQPGLNRLSKRPWIAGTWAATLRPTDASRIPNGGNRGPIETYFVIKQSFWSIAVRQYTTESRSESQTAVWTQTNGDSTLRFIYANQPLQVLEERSRPHIGTTTFDVVGLRPTAIVGDYFTDRYTKGDLHLRLVDRSDHHADFSSAQTYCSSRVN